MHLQTTIRFIWTWIDETLTQYRIDEGQEPPLGNYPHGDIRVGELPREAREILVPLEWPCPSAGDGRTIDMGEYPACGLVRKDVQAWLERHGLVEKLREQAPARAAEAREKGRQAEERRAREAKAHREHAERVKQRQAEKAEKEARESEERERLIDEWIKTNGTESQRERLGAGLLPLTEALDAMRDSLYAPLSEEARFQRLRPADIDHQDYCGVHAASHAEWNSYEATEVSDEEWQRVKALSHLARGAECEVIEHCGTCRACEGTVTRRSIRVTITHGVIRFTREYAI